MSVARGVRVWAAVLFGGLRALGVQLPVRNYTTSDGLPTNSTVCLTRDSAGFLWLCTTHGLARFDGKSFDLFGTAAHPCLRA